MVLNMDRKKVFLLLISLVLTSLFASFVLAQQHQGDTFKLTEIFETIKGFDVFEAYQKFPFLIDTLIYFLFFISIAMATLGQHFKGNGGKGVVIAMGLALSVGISYWAKKVGFKLGNLGPLAALIFALVIGIWIYRIVRGENEAGAGIWISIIVIWVAFNMFFPQLVNTLQENKWGNMLLGVLTLLFIVALPMAATQFFKGSGERGRDEGGRWGGLWPGGGREPRTPEERRKKEEKEEEEEEKKEKEEEDKEVRAEIRDTAREIGELRKIHDEIGRLKGGVDRLLTAAPPNWPATINAYNRSVNDVKDDLNNLIELDERIKAHAERLYERYRSRVSRSGRARTRAGDRRRIIREIRDIYAAGTLIEAMIASVIGKLDSTRNLLRISTAWTTPYTAGYPGAPPTIPTPNESTILQAVLNEIKEAYNKAARLYNIEKRVLREIR